MSTTLSYGNKDGLKVNLGIGIIYLFHVSAIIGVSIGYFDWFITKTPLNLSLMLAIFGLGYAFNSLKVALFALLCFSVGYIAEWLGVNHGLIFGDYLYGENLGTKVGGVPLLIGVNWVLLVMSTATIASRWISSKWIRAAVGAGLMVGLDLFMEKVAPPFDFWSFEGGTAPLSNYIGWFAVALILQMVFQLMKIQGSHRMSLHFFLSQILFFGYFYVYYSL